MQQLDAHHVIRHSSYPRKFLLLSGLYGIHALQAFLLMSVAIATGSSCRQNKM